MFKLVAKQNQLACSEALYEMTRQCSLSINNAAVRIRQAIHQHMCYAQLTLCNISALYAQHIRSSR